MKYLKRINESESNNTPFTNKLTALRNSAYDYITSHVGNETIKFYDFPDDGDYTYDMYEDDESIVLDLPSFQVQHKYTMVTYVGYMIQGTQITGFSVDSEDWANKYTIDLEELDTTAMCSLADCIKNH